MSDSKHEEDRPVEYVAILTVNGPIEEAQVRSFLEGSGIPSRVRGEALRNTHAITVDGIGAAEIEVPAELAQAARELIEMADRGELALPDDANGDPPENPEAGPPEKEGT